jgi:glycerol-3-phosphate dehydrogenase subunit C
VCPVFGANPEYPGPKRLGPELERMRREGISADTKWVDYCLGCHRCDLVCPNQVNVSEMIARAKGTYHKPPVRWLRDWWFARPGLIGLLATIMPKFSNFALSLKIVRFFMSKMMMITPKRIFPAYTRPDLRAPAMSGHVRERVVFFPGCFILYNQPDLGRKVIDLLDRNGFDTEVASTECCGIPASANGDPKLARALARANVRSLASQVDAGLRIVAVCPSCTHMLKTGFGCKLEDDKKFAGEARKIAANTYDLGELLMAQSDAGKFNMDFKQTDLHLAYHAPCHQKSQGIGRPWYHLLRQIPGVTIEDLDAGCCGMSGTYGFKQEKYNVSMAIGQNLFDSINAAQPQMVVTECATCKFQIEHGTAVKVAHPVDIMLQAYDGSSAEMTPRS